MIWRWFHRMKKQRRTGNAPKGADGLPIVRTTPICAIGAESLHEEFHQNKLEGPSSNRVSNLEEVTGGEEARLVIQKERGCEKSTKWMPLLSLKEHIDMNLLEQANLRQNERDRQQQEWQAAQEEKRQKREDYQEEERRKREDKRDRRQNVALWIAAAALFAGPILTWALSRLTQPSLSVQPLAPSAATQPTTTAAPSSLTPH